MDVAVQNIEAILRVKVPNAASMKYIEGIRQSPVYTI